jgi:hypothetical protein
MKNVFWDKATQFVEVSTAVTMKNAVFFRDVTPCGTYKNRRFGETYRIHYQGDKTQLAANLAITSKLRNASCEEIQEPRGVTSQKTAFFAFGGVSW